MHISFWVVNRRHTDECVCVYAKPGGGRGAVATMTRISTILRNTERNIYSLRDADFLSESRTSTTIRQKLCAHDISPKVLVCGVFREIIVIMVVVGARRSSRKKPKAAQAQQSGQLNLRPNCLLEAYYSFLVHAKHTFSSHLPPHIHLREYDFKKIYRLSYVMFCARATVESAHLKYSTHMWCKYKIYDGECIYDAYICTFSPASRVYFACMTCNCALSPARCIV